MEAIARIAKYSVSHVEPHGEKDITFTPKVDCDIFVLCAVSGVWGYGGGAITMWVDCDQLEAASICMAVHL